MRLLALPVLALVVLGFGPAVEETGTETATALAANATPAAGSARFLVSFGSEREAGVINLGDETAVLDNGAIFGSGSRYWPIPRREAAVLGIPEKRWYENRAGGYALVSDPFLTGARSLFEVIGHAERVQGIGRGTERGTPVQRYSAKVPLEAFLAEFPPFEKKTTTKPGDDGPTSWREYLVDYIGAAEGGQSLELAADSQGRIRRARLELYEPVTVELYDYGVSVEITPPRESEVISSTAYEKLKSDYCSDPGRQTLPRPYPCS